jgi:hypothetical protein
MYLSDMGLPGLDASPARFHILTEYRLDLTDETWQVEELEQLLSMDAAFEPEVETALETLQDRGLVERVGERERPGPPLEPGDYGTTAVWEPTVEGRAEASAIRQAYSEEVEALAEAHGTDSDEFRDEIVSLARTYGILPSYFG